MDTKTIMAAKAVVDAPTKVSCADIIALTAIDVFLVVIFLIWSIRCNNKKLVHM
jgi:hypothetical protein